jgi:uncharacterized protein
VPPDLSTTDVDRGRPPRLDGIDLARFVAIAGMVVVHARTDLVLLPLERAVGGEPDLPPASAGLEVWQAIATNRARLLFFMLAGVGAALVTRRGGLGVSGWWRRAAFLALLGVGLVALGWSDLVLVFYGVLFVLAPVLVRLPTPALLATTVVSAAPAVLLLSVDGGRDDTVTNVLRVVGEIVPLFCLGVVLGRADLSQARTRRLVAAAGAALSLPGLLVLTATGGLDVTEVGGGWEPVAALTSTVGLCLLVVWACVQLALAAPRATRPLTAVGAMPLTAYVGHALVFTVLSRSATWGLASASAVAVAYRLGAGVFAHWWRHRWGSGPLERLMRVVTRTSGGGTSRTSPTG